MKLKFRSSTSKSADKESNVGAARRSLARARFGLSQAVGGVLSGSLGALGERLGGPREAARDTGATTKPPADRMREMLRHDRELNARESRDPDQREHDTERPGAADLALGFESEAEAISREYARPEEFILVDDSMVLEEAPLDQEALLQADNELLAVAFEQVGESVAGAAVEVPVSAYFGAALVHPDAEVLARAYGGEAPVEPGVEISALAYGDGAEASTDDLRARSFEVAGDLRDSDAELLAGDVQVASFEAAASLDGSEAASLVDGAGALSIAVGPGANGSAADALNDDVQVASFEAAASLRGREAALFEAASSSLRESEAASLVDGAGALSFEIAAHLHASEAEVRGLDDRVSSSDVAGRLDASVEHSRAAGSESDSVMNLAEVNAVPFAETPFEAESLARVETASVVPPRRGSAARSGDDVRIDSASQAASSQPISTAFKTGSSAAAPVAKAGAARGAEREPGDPIRTRTMARLLAAQGYRARALSIYDELLAAGSGDEALRVEADRLR